MEIDERFEAACRGRRIAPSSLKEYVARALRIREVSGLPLGFEGLRRFVRLRATLAAATLRTYKSAVAFVLCLGLQPLSPEEHRRLDEMITGIEVVQGRPEKVRGAPSEKQIEALYAYAHRSGGAELALSLVVAFGTAMRAQDLEALEGEDIDLEAAVVWVPRKGPIVTKVRYGSQQERPITTEHAFKVLAALKEQRKPRDKVFPGFRRSEATRVVREMATADGWDPDLLWTGIHNLRHSRAATLLQEGLQRVRDAGGWKGRDAEHRYGRQARIGPKDRERFRTHAGKRQRED
jgi:integrase